MHISGAPVFLDGQPLIHQLLNRFPHRHTANAQLLGDLALHQACPRDQASLVNRFLQPLRDLNLTSTYAWVYGAYPFRGVPSDGTPRRFYDEIHVALNSYPAGTVFKLQKDSGNTAAYYDIDFIETEVVPAAYAMPAGAFSITSYGAVSGGGGFGMGLFSSWWSC